MIQNCSLWKIETSLGPLHRHYLTRMNHHPTDMWQYCGEQTLRATPRDAQWKGRGLRIGLGGTAGCVTSEEQPGRLRLYYLHRSASKSGASSLWRFDIRPLFALSPHEREKKFASRVRTSISAFTMSLSSWWLRQSCTAFTTRRRRRICKTCVDAAIMSS